MKGIALIFSKPFKKRKIKKIIKKKEKQKEFPFMKFFFPLIKTFYSYSYLFL